MRQSVGDMIRSMALVLGVVFLIVLLAWRPQPEAVKVVETAPTVQRAASEAEFDVTAPNGLADGWRPTSVRWEPTEESLGDPVLHVGYVTPSDQYAQVSESAAQGPRYLDEQTKGGAVTGTQDIDGTSWERRETQSRRSLVLQEGSVVTVVSGSADWNELIALASALEPVATEG